MDEEKPKKHFFPNDIGMIDGQWWATENGEFISPLNCNSTDGEASAWVDGSKIYRTLPANCPICGNEMTWFSCPCLS